VGYSEALVISYQAKLSLPGHRFKKKT